jgi:hypothetical protein
MRTLILALAGTAVAMTAGAADARHRGRTLVCVNYRHGHCIHYARTARPMMVRHGTRYRTGYVFGPSYGYTAYSALPQPYVTRYHLSPDYRYVYSGNTVYVVDPTTYAITRILNGIH